METFCDSDCYRIHRGNGQTGTLVQPIVLGDETNVPSMLFTPRGPSQRVEEEVKPLIALTIVAIFRRNRMNTTGTGVRRSTVSKNDEDHD